MDALNELKTYVRQLPRGLVLEVVVVETLLVKCWDLLEISDYSSMEDYKLDGRTEGLSWNPPFLTFQKIKSLMALSINLGAHSITEIKRHGDVVMEGKDTVICSWEVNVEEGTAIGVEGL